MPIRMLRGLVSGVSDVQSPFQQFCSAKNSEFWAPLFLIFSQLLCNRKTLLRHRECMFRKVHKEEREQVAALKRMKRNSTEATEALIE